MKKADKSSSAGTKADSSTTADNLQVSQPIAKPLVNCRDNGLKFSIINLKKLVGNSWVAEFFYSYGDRIKPFETAIHGTSSENCIKRVEDFLETKLNYYELSVHGS